MLDMRFKGVRVDIDLAEQLNDQYLKDEAKMLGELRDTAGFMVEPWSADDLGKAFEQPMREGKDGFVIAGCQYFRPFGQQSLFAIV